MRILGPVLILGALMAGAWALGFFEPAPEPDPEPEEAPHVVEAAPAPALEAKGKAPTPEAEGAPGDALPELDPDTFLATLANKEGAALQKALMAYLRYPVKPTDAVVRRLLEILETEDPKGAAWGLARVRLATMPPSILPYLLPWVKGSNTALQTAAVYILENWLRRKLSFDLPDVAPLLASDDRYVRHATLGMLSWGVPHEPRLADRLVRLSRDGNRLAMKALARMGDPAERAYRGLFEDAEPRRRQELYLALAGASPERLRGMLDLLREGAADDDDEVASAALLVLGYLGADAKPALPELRQALRTELDGPVKGALRVIEKLGPDGAPAVGEVLVLLEYRDETVTELAARVLGHIGTGRPEVREALVAFIHKEASDVAARSLASFGDEGLAAALAMIDGDDEDARFAALWTLATLGEGAAVAVPRLIPMIEQEEDVALRQRAIGTAGYIGPKAAAVIPAIMQAFRSEVMPLLASDASGTMTRLGPPAREAIHAGLRGDHPVVQLRCAELLHAWHGATQFALDDLQRLLGAKDVALRRAAMVAIRTSVMHPMKQGVRYPALHDKALHARLGAVFQRAAEDEREDARVRAYAMEGREFLKYIDAHAAAWLAAE